MAEERIGWAVVMVMLWVAVAWAVGWVGVLDGAEEVHSPRGFLGSCQLCIASVAPELYLQLVRP